MDSKKPPPFASFPFNLWWPFDHNTTTADRYCFIAPFYLRRAKKKVFFCPCSSFCIIMSVRLGGDPADRSCTHSPTSQRKREERVYIVYKTRSSFSSSFHSMAIFFFPFKQEKGKKNCVRVGSESLNKTRAAGTGQQNAQECFNVLRFWFFAL